MIWPGLAILVSVIIAAVPWGLPGEATFVLPFITLLLIFLFSAAPQKMVPPWLVFIAGLATDILTAGPLGYWAFLFTFCHALARLMAHRIAAQSIVGLWLQFLPVVSLVAVSGWVLASLYYLRIIEWWPIALGAIAAFTLLPLAAALLRRRPPDRGFRDFAAVR